MTTPASGERVVRLSPERLTGWLERFATRHGTLTTAVEGEEAVVTAGDGAVARLWLPWGTPPGADGDALARVVEDLLRPRRVGVVLVRRRAHAVGIFEGADLVSYRRDSHYVQGRTKAGGWSQQRYSRRRANQASHAFAEAAEDAAAQLLPEVPGLDAVVTGGDRAAVRAVLDTAGLEPLRRLAQANRHPVHPVPDPTTTVLAGFGETLREVRIRLNELA